MSTITYKCPNCDADLTYRPATGDFGCEYCGSSYTGEQLNELIKNQKIIDEQKESEGTAFDEHAVVYTCPNCGAVNKGKFCMECGAKKPDSAPLYKCDKCGWEPNDPKNPPKFCPQCGDPFNDNDVKK